MQLIKKHFFMELEEKGEYTGIREFRKHIGYYTKCLPDSSAFRGSVNLLQTKEEVVSALDDYFNKIEKL